MQAIPSYPSLQNPDKLMTSVLLSRNPPLKNYYITIMKSLFTDKHLYTHIEQYYLNTYPFSNTLELDKYSFHQGKQHLVSIFHKFWQDKDL